MQIGPSLSDASEDDPVSVWGNDAAVYSSQSELSEWDASDTESMQEAQSLDVLDQIASGELSLTSIPTGWQGFEMHGVLSPDMCLYALLAKGWAHIMLRSPSYCSKALQLLVSKFGEH